MKVFFICPNLNVGGAEKNTVNLINEMHSLGKDVSLILIKVEGEFLKDVCPDIEIINLNKSRSRYSILALARILKKHQPTLVVSMLRETSLLSSLVFKFFRLKTYLVIREACQYFDDGRVYKFILKRLYSRANLFVANSEETLSSFLNQNLLSEKQKKIVIPNPVIDSNFFKLLRAPFSHTWLDDPSLTVLTSAGRLVKEKGYYQLIEAFNLLFKKEDSYRLIIIGAGPEKGALIYLINKLNLSKYIDLIGFDKFPAKYFKKSDLFISSSTNEAFGNVIVEALASGVKVLCRNSGGPIEILQDGKIGTLESFDTSSMLAECIEKSLIKEEDKSVRVGRSKDFFAKDIVQEYLSLFREIDKESRFEYK